MVDYDFSLESVFFTPLTRDGRDFLDMCDDTTKYGGGYIVLCSNAPDLEQQLCWAGFTVEEKE